MIAILVESAFRRYARRPADLLLTFVVPVVFFSIFALIFQRQGNRDTTTIKAVFVDEDQSTASKTLVTALTESPAIQQVQVSGTAAVLSRSDAEALVWRGVATIAIIVPTDFAANLAAPQDSPLVELLADTSNPVACQIVEALSMATIMRLRGQLAARSIPQPVITGVAYKPEAASVPLATEPADFATTGATPIRTVDVLGQPQTNANVTMYAAGIAVMFLLFGAVGAAGTLLEEREAGTLERLLSTRLTMTELLLGKWLFATLLGTLQVAVMFAWAQVVFRVDVVGHLPALVIVTFATAAAAASFAMVLATACNNRTQLNGIAVVTILCMSALGGSMVPRFLMSEDLQHAGRFVFNSWALDAYTKVFWRDLPLAELGPELLVLGTSAIGLLGIARLLARRWEG